MAAYTYADDWYILADRFSLDGQGGADGGAHAQAGDPAAEDTPVSRPVLLAQQLDMATRATEDFARDMRLKAAPTKCWTFGSSPEVRKRLREFQLFGGEVKAAQTSGRILGAHVQFGGVVTAGAHLDRMSAAVARAQRPNGCRVSLKAGRR